MEQGTILQNCNFVGEEKFGWKTLSVSFERIVVIVQMEPVSNAC